MTTTTTQELPVEGPTTGRRGRSTTPPGHRVLHLIIDQGTFDLIHLCALKSRMKFTAYMQRFLREAFPYALSEAPTAAEGVSNDPSEDQLGNAPPGPSSPAF